MPLGGSDFEAIQIAINATGQGGVQSLRNEAAQLDAQVQRLTATITAQGGPTAKQIQDLSRLKQEYNDLADAVTAAERVVRGLGPAFTNSQGQIRGASQAVLEFSRGLEDFATGGVLGALNNIPRFFGGIGQAAGLAAPQVAILEAGATALATAGYTVWRNWDQVKQLFDDGLSPKMLDTVKDLQDRLKELEEKPVKAAVDYVDITNARKEVERLTEAEKEYQAARQGKTVEEAEQSKLVRQAIVEQGGGPDAVARAAAALTPTTEGGATRKAREQLAFIDDPRNAGRGGTDPATRARIAKALADAQAADAANHLKATQDIIGGALGGDESQRAWLEALVRANRQRFADAGASPDFAQALRGSSREAIRSREEDKARAEIEKERAEQAKAKAQTAAQAERVANSDAEYDAQGLLDLNRDAARIRRQNEAEAKRKAQEKARKDAQQEREGRVNARRSEVTPAEARRNEASQLGQEFQSRARQFEGVDVPGRTAEQAGKMVQGLMDKGLGTDAAMIQVFQQLMGLVNKMNQNQAAQAGFINQAMNMINQQGARSDAIAQNLRRNQQRGRSYLPTFALLAMGLGAVPPGLSPTEQLQAQQVFAQRNMSRFGSGAMAPPLGMTLQ